jgi:hypothetical protein
MHGPLNVKFLISQRTPTSENVYRPGKKVDTGKYNTIAAKLPSRRLICEELLQLSI